MKGLYLAVSLILLSVLSFNCQKELSSGPVLPGTGNNSKNPITATLQGNIVDETGQPASGVSIRVGSKTAITNAKGYFRISNAALDKNASLVTAEKSGYFKAYRTFNATSGVNQVNIKLLQKTSVGDIDAAAGGNVTLSNGSKIALPAAGVVKAAGGAAFTGTVKVYATYIDPTSSDIAQTVPGSFMANDKNNNRVTLASYGMLAVELESAAGEKLQIAPTSTATLTSPIPSSLLSSAPATIALWFVDEQTGIWKEEGTATKNGSNYVGEVKHFSFWNCDIGIPAVTLTATLKNNEGIPIVHGMVKIARSTGNFWDVAYGCTDTLGQVSGLVPANENLVLSVLDPCNNVIYTQNITPLTQNTNLGTITVSNPTSPSLLTIKGQLKNCTNGAVTNGYALINYDNVTRYASVNSLGEFAVSFLKCSGGPATAEVIGVDAGSQQQGNVVSVTITTPLTNAGVVVACGTSAAQFINYTIDGTNYSISSSVVGDSLSSYTYQTQGTPPMMTGTSGWSLTTNNNISFNFDHNAGTGTYDVRSLYVQTYDSIMIVQPFTVTLTNYPASVGGFYEGTFTGKFKEIATPIPIHNINGSFRLRRMN
ncbi:MAG: carboxypeptidase regulatory-like domain-containing protein [Chitinophagaceae bacterium]|nr:carboxypeptidase regulatory-like domain-containing protein [Chitinophagaceae bacterium]